MPTSQIQTTVDVIANQQISNQFGTQRYALLFMPGTYGNAASPLVFQVGYYTEVAGLGASPTDVTINGHVDVNASRPSFVIGRDDRRRRRRSLSDSNFQTHQTLLPVPRFAENTGSGTKTAAENHREKLRSHHGNQISAT